MPNEYPEHIDQLDNFYQQHLAELEILPPADMWDRISVSYAEGKAGQDKSGFLFNNRKKLIGIVAATLFISASTYFYLANSNKHTPEHDSGAPFVEKENDKDSSSLYPEETQNIVNSSPVEKDNKGKSSYKQEDVVASPSVKTSSTTNKHYIDKTTEESTEMILNEPALEEKETKEVQAEVIEVKAPKKKVSFKDKHKKEYQDSTRNLFVPGK